MASNDLPSIEIRCIPDNQYAVIGVINTKRFRLEIETKNNSGCSNTIKRNPLNLVLVLDRSGSMNSDKKLNFAKQAIHSVLNLIDDDDIIHLVTYDDTVSTVFENSNGSDRQKLHSIVEEINSGGQTNLSGGIRMGLALFEKYPHLGYSKRLFVLSDGLANVGLRTRRDIMREINQHEEKGIIIDSFGIGSDFDEMIMKGIAEAGRGQFYFLESAEIIISLMTKALQSVFDIFGTRSQLIIRGINNSIITKIWGHENIALGANLGDLHIDNLRVILCDFTTFASVPDGTQVDVLEYQLKYNHLSDIDQEQQSIDGKLSLIFVNNESFVQEINPKVKILHAVQIAAEIDDRIAQLIENRERDSAIQLIDEQINILRQVQHLDDEQRMIEMLVRMAEHMQKRLKERKINEKMAGKHYGHHGHLKRCYDVKYTHHYADDD